MFLYVMGQACVPYPRENTPTLFCKKSRRLIVNGEFSFEYMPTRGLKLRFTLCSIIIIMIILIHSMNISLTTTCYKLMLIKA